MSENILHKKDIENGALKYDFVMSLTNIAAVKIATTLWMSKNIQHRIKNLFHNPALSYILFDPALEQVSFMRGNNGFYFNKWESEIENAAINKVAELLMPESFNQIIMSLVKHMGRSICDWIQYHDEYIFSLHSAVDFIDNIKWTTTGAISYGETARHILFRPDKNLNNDCRYKLACNFCLKDTFEIIAPKVLFPWYLNGVDINKHPMVYFWTARITDNNARLYDVSFFKDIQQNGRSHNEYIFQLLIRNFEYKAINEIAIKYMWNELNDEEKAKNVSILIGSPGGQEFKLSILCGLDYETQRKVLEKDAFSVLYYFLDNWLIEKLFLPTVIHMIDYVDSICLMQILEKLAEKMIDNHRKYDYARYKRMFKQLCQVGSNRIKNPVSNLYHFYYSLYVVTVCLSWERDMDMIDMIFSFLTVGEKRGIILTSDGIKKCVDFILEDRWDLLELFIRYTLPPKEDLGKLKKSIIEEQGKRIVVHYVAEGKFDKLQYFMNWAFRSEEDIKRFKNDFLSSKFFKMY